MSAINKYPVIQSLIGSLTREQTTALASMINGGSTPIFRSLINPAHKITNSDKGVSFMVLETIDHTYTGYFIYNNTHCMLVSFVDDQQGLNMLRINTTNWSYVLVDEYLDVNEFRRVITDALIGQGEDLKVQVNDIESGDLPEDQIILSDGEGGATWKDLDEAIVDSAESGVVAEMVGVDASGNLVKGPVPEGSVTDNALDTASTNPIQNKPVAEAIEDIEGSLAEEYDATGTYDLGDYAIYGHELYKCKVEISAGEAWDPTHWDKVTVGDELNDKANVDGNYPTMTVGFSGNLTPYSSSSGDDQDEPFLFQGTACGNGTEQVDTGSFAQLKEKRGNTVVVNQLSNPANYQYETHTENDITATFNKTTGVITLSGTASADTTIGLFNNNQFSLVQGKKYLVKGCKDGSLSTYYLRVYFQGTEYGSDTGNGFIFTSNGTTTANVLSIVVKSGTNVNGVKFLPSVIGLTQWFGSNSAIPAYLLSHPEAWLNYYQGSLASNAGTLTNANSRYLKTFGRNQWDEVTESGNIGISNGVPFAADDWFRSKNFIRVIPGVTYYFKISTAIRVYEYDINGNFLGAFEKATSSNTTVPLNCAYLKISQNASSYNNDICISIYYSGESGYDQYYPYEELADVDTGTETLRSAGSVADSKAPDGTITRRVGTYTFTGSESATFRRSGTAGDCYLVSNLLNGLPQSLSNLLGAVLCSNGYSNVGANAVYAGDALGIAFDYRTAYFCVPSGKTVNEVFPNGTVLYYELATPTTEAGTPFQESIDIDDFGSMSFDGTSGVPQGNLVFYPVDYKAFTDTLYNHLGGDGNNATPLVGEGESMAADDPETLKGEITARNAADAIILNAVGGTLRQCLCVKETLDFDDTDFVDLGSLTWEQFNNTDVWFSSAVTGIKLPSSDSVTPKILCTLVKAIDRDHFAVGTICIDRATSGLWIAISGTSSMMATTFKAAMKNVLLAYEKASE